jgi:hypothetical protein
MWMYLFDPNGPSFGGSRKLYEAGGCNNSLTNASASTNALGCLLRMLWENSGYVLLQTPKKKERQDMVRNRTTLAKSDRTDRETFYLLTMTADLTKIVHMGEEMTEEECRVSFAEQRMPEAEISEQIENARKRKAIGR